MKKLFLSLVLFVALIGASSQITRADSETDIPLRTTPDLFEKGTYHVVRYVSDVPIKNMGLINNQLLVSFSDKEHAWFLNDRFVRVSGTDPAKALGYPSMQTAESFKGIPKKHACEKYKDAVSAVTINPDKFLCLSSTAGGDFTLRVLPAAKPVPVNIGFGKHPILENTRLSWIGYDGNLYIAYFHPSFFSEVVTAVKSKTNPTVFLVRNGMRYSIPSEAVFFTWFDSFASVSVLDAKKLAASPVQAKAGYKANTLIQFSDSPNIYVYQPANSPQLVYGKSVKILEDKPDRWILQDPKNAKKNIELLKRPERLRHIKTEADAQNTFGTTWTKRIVVLDAALKSTYTISDKAFSPKTDIVYE